MSPIRHASKALADVMQRAERRGADAERKRLAARAQHHHEQAGHGPEEFWTCPDPCCAALADVIEASSRS